jgi:hypothetical protein
LPRAQQRTTAELKETGFWLAILGAGALVYAGEHAGGIPGRRRRKPRQWHSFYEVIRETFD